MKTKFTTAVAFSLAASGIVSAQANDDCTGAVALPIGAATAFDTTLATQSVEVWNCAGGGGPDLWYSVTPTMTGASLVIETCGSSYDTALEIYDGTCAALSLLSCNDDACGLQSTVSFGPTTAGVPVFMRVGGFAGNVGPGTLLATEVPPLGPEDNCTGAIPLVSGAPTAFDTTGATNSSPTWTCAGSGGSDIWFTYTTTMAMGRVQIETCGSSYDTAIDAFTGSCAALNLEGCNDDACGLQSTLLLNSPGAGTTFFIRVGGFNGAQGPGTILLTEIPPASISQFNGSPPNATGTLDFDNPPVASGPIGSSDPVFTTFGIASINLVGPWNSVGDTLTNGSNVFGQSLVSDASGVLTVGGVGDPLDNPDPDSGFDILLNGTSTQFGVRFSDQVGFTYTLELLLNGTSLGIESFVYGNGFPADAHYWTAQAGAFNQVVIRFQNAGGVGLDEIAFDGGMGTLGSPYCLANPNSTGATGSLAAMGSPLVVDNDVTLTASDLPLSSFGFFIVSPTQGFVPNPAGSAGNLCLAGAVGRYVGPGQIQNTGGSGSFDLLLDLAVIPGPMGSSSTSSGDTWNFQTWHRDSGMAGPTSNFTHGLSITFQ